MPDRIRGTNSRMPRIHVIFNAVSIGAERTSQDCVISDVLLCDLQN
jgi:hypothetical protein